MRAIRVRISTLIGLVVACALGLAALRRASPETEQVVFTATVIALILAILRAVHRPGAARAYWSAFALVGGTYLALSLIPTTSGRLATSRALGYIFPWVSNPATTSNQGPAMFWGSVDYSTWGAGQTLNSSHVTYTQVHPVLSNPNTGIWSTVSGNGALVPQNSAAFDPSGNTLLFTGKFHPDAIDWQSFERSGHDLFAWLWGAIAGTIARTWWAGPKRRQAWDRLGRSATRAS